MSKVKLLFIIPTLTVGGVEVSLINLIKNLDKDRYDIHVMAINGDSDSDIKKQLPQGVSYHYIYRQPKLFGRRIRGIAYLLSIVFRYLKPTLLHKLFIKEKFDVEIAYHGWFGLKLITGAESSITKTYAWIHSDVSGLKSPIGVNWVPFRSKKEVLEAYLSLDNVVCVSEKSKEIFMDSYSLPLEDRSKVIVKYNVLPYKNIIKKSNESINIIRESNAFLICAVGRLDEGKGFERLIRSCKKLLDEGLNIELWIIGEGEQREYLERVITDYSLIGNVKLLGLQLNPYKYMAFSNLFVNASYSESYSLVVAEAVILGVPVLSTDTTGVREILGDSEFGYIVSNDDNSLYEGLKKMLMDKDFYNIYKERVKLKSNSFNSTKNVKQIEELFLGEIRNEN